VSSPLTIPLLDKSRYRLIGMEGRTVLLRDDGTTISYMVVWPPDHQDHGQWRLWAKYETLGISMAIANELMRTPP
jgi:hypothetical protein